MISSMVVTASAGAPTVCQSLCPTTPGGRGRCACFPERDPEAWEVVDGRPWRRLAHLEWSSEADPGDDQAYSGAQASSSGLRSGLGCLR